MNQISAMKKYQLSILLLFLIIAFANQRSQSQTTSGHKFILDLYEDWKSDQIANRTYVSLKDCTIDAVINDDNHPLQGIPDEFVISYALINDDGVLDALVTFSPQQCDGGNAMMNAQSSVLILSEGAGYIWDDTFIDDVVRKYNQSTRTWGLFWIDRASGGTLFGTYSAYKDEDPRCCPSIKRKFHLSYATKELTFFDE